MHPYIHLMVFYIKRVSLKSDEHNDILNMKVIIIKSIGCRINGVVLNRVDTMNFDGMMTEVNNTLELDILSVIPNDPKIREATMKMVPPVIYIPESPSSIAITKLAANIASVKNKPTIKEGRWFQRLIGKSMVKGIEKYGPN